MLGENQCRIDDKLCRNILMISYAEMCRIMKYATYYIYTHIKYTHIYIYIYILPYGPHTYYYTCICYIICIYIYIYMLYVHVIPCVIYGTVIGLKVLVRSFYRESNILFMKDGRSRAKDF